MWFQDALAVFWYFGGLRLPLVSQNAALRATSLAWRPSIALFEVMPRCLKPFKAPVSMLLEPERLVNSSLNWENNGKQ